MSNIIGFKIDEAGHTIITYVAANGLRETFDLTQHTKDTALAVVAEHKLHGHQL